MSDAPRHEGEDELLAAWDTCSDRGVIALGAGGKLLVESYFQTEKGHTGSLMPLLDSALDSVGAGPAQLTALAVGTGPGTFTGVKVGVTTAKALALALQVPVVGFSTLDALAAGAPAAELVVACADARRGQYYAAAYSDGDTRQPQALPYSCLDPEPLRDALLALPGRTVTLAGEAPELVVEALRADGREVLIHAERSPQGAALLYLARAALADERVESAVSLMPIYLKRPV